MTLVLAILLGWLGATVFVLVMAWSVSRMAALADRDTVRRIREAASRTSDRRVGPPDRREGARPWASASPGRRAEDALRRELADAQRAAREAEAKLAEFEVRKADGAA